LQEFIMSEDILSVPIFLLLDNANTPHGIKTYYGILKSKRAERNALKVGKKLYGKKLKGIFLGKKERKI